MLVTPGGGSLMSDMGRREFMTLIGRARRVRNLRDGE
jgi:hypothetical protein